MSLFFRATVVCLLVAAGGAARAQSVLVINCDGGGWAGGFVAYVDGAQIGQYKGSARLEGLAPGGHLLRVDVWQNPFKHTVWYEGRIDLPRDTEVRARVTQGKIDIYGRSRLEPVAPPPPQEMPPQEMPPPAQSQGPGTHHRLKRAIRDTQGAATSAPPRCQRNVNGALEELRGRMDTGKLRGAVRRLREVEQMAADDCPQVVTAGLTEVDAALIEYLGGREEMPPIGPQPGPPAAAPPPCWNPSDPGCYATKRGNLPMGPPAFAGLQQALHAVKPNVFQMAEVLKAQMMRNYLTSMQLQTLIRMFKPHTFEMLAMVKDCAPKLVDPQNGMGVAAELGPNTIMVQDAARIIGEQRGDQ